MPRSAPAIPIISHLERSNEIQKHQRCIFHHNMTSGSPTGHKTQCVTQSVRFRQSVSFCRLKIQVATLGPTKESNMEGLWTLRGISNFVTFHSFWEMDTRKYSGFLRYNLRKKTVSVYLNPYGGANGLIVLTRYDHATANYLTRVKPFIQTATQDVTVNRHYCCSSWA